MSTNNTLFGSDSVVVAPTVGTTNEDFTITFQKTAQNGKVSLANANLPQIVPIFTGNGVQLLPAGPARIDASTKLEGAGNATQTLTLSGSPGSTIVLSFNGVASLGAPLQYIPATSTTTASPTAAQVQAHLAAIPADPNLGINPALLVH